MLNETSLSYCVDWISVTVKTPLPVSLYPEGLCGQCEETTPKNGYTLGFRYKDGRLEFYHPQQERMGVHVIYGGECLRVLCEQYHCSPAEIVDYYMRIKTSHFTRIDLAIDARGYGLTPLQLFEECEMGDCATKATKHPIVNGGVGQGSTLYIGHKSSAAYLKIYEKGIEQGTDEDWLRLELTVKTDKMQSLIGTTGGNFTGTGIQAMVKGYADFPRNRQYQRITGEDMIYLQMEKPGESDTRKWLMQIVSNCVADKVISGEDDSLFNDFISHTAKLILEGKKKKEASKRNKAIIRKMREDHKSKLVQNGQ